MIFERVFANSIRFHSMPHKSIDDALLGLRLCFPDGCKYAKGEGDDAPRSLDARAEALGELASVGANVETRDTRGELCPVIHS